MSQQFQYDTEIKMAILTVSDTRDYHTDKGGALVEKLASASQIRVIERKICRDELLEIRETLKQWANHPEVDCIITTGGTGIATRDVTIEAIQPLFNKEIPGFGELFRYLSFTEDIGTRAMASRAVAGVVNNKVIFTLPGSTGAVKLAMEKLILTELNHLVFELKKRAK
ncbi:MogA/MoaB family molybdenum cofactor biosynthesis protein [Lysinibacillus antri]|uniref:Molybdenum cofactor biosynthesis protein B n=1 Tax=Lysinibacillus antri TaxID=2498145 RepID=A0A3S0R6D7_9BACI|nr:MogA/MoaB family molybdenum cofactor biosynthesis protein [Lysinibacillus antri]RUL52232.1 MogA/MoaB family molybdenum cofactor biosynthesis protein [Lysinibacillus antri]